MESDMPLTPETYLSPFTDYGFKRLFGQQSDPQILRDFLNTLLVGEAEPIAEITYLNTEQLGLQHIDRNAVFDLYCKTDRGSYFIVELQKSKQNYFKDRSLFYASFPIQQQAQKGNWDFRLDPVYSISILNFEFDDVE